MLAHFCRAQVLPYVKPYEPRMPLLTRIACSFERLRQSAIWTSRPLAYFIQMIAPEGIEGVRVPLFPLHALSKRAQVTNRKQWNGDTEI